MFLTRFRPTGHVPAVHILRAGIIQLNTSKQASTYLWILDAGWLAEKFCFSLAPCSARVGTRNTRKVNILAYGMLTRGGARVTAVENAHVPRKTHSFASLSTLGTECRILTSWQ